MSVGAWSATVYKWVDDNGVTHYSDQPSPKAEKLQVTGAQTYRAPAAAAAAPPGVAAPLPSAPAVVCAIDSPGAGQVFLDTFTLTGHVTLAHVGEGSQAALRLDGMDISALLEPSGSFTLDQVDRGDHTLTLQVTSAQGEVICQGGSVTFSVRQRSVVPPNAPTAPAAPGVNRRSGS